MVMCENVSLYMEDLTHMYMRCSKGHLFLSQWVFNPYQGAPCDKVLQKGNSFLSEFYIEWNLLKSFILDRYIEIH